MVSDDSARVVDPFNSNNSIDGGDNDSIGNQLNDSLPNGIVQINKTLSEPDSAEPPAKKPKGNIDDFSKLDADITFQEAELNFKFNPLMENVQIEEDVKWLSNSGNDVQNLSPDVLHTWLKWGEQKTTIDDDSRFCDPLILQQILNAKTKFDGIDRHEIDDARAKCNPFEAIKCSIFQNRSAVKIANIDAALNFMFTDPKDENGESLVRDLLHFADICAGPGGFSEYILWRNKWNAKGIGFTLRNEDDFNMHAFSAGKTETFSRFYGVKEDGNILDPENIQSLQQYVLQQTNGTGVCVLMADGGFSVIEKNSQEILSKRLYLCQCLAALSLVQKGGHFIVKLFDVFTLFSAGLVYLMHQCFKQITIIKPNASRPGSSERFLIGKYKKMNTDTIRDYLCRINQTIWDNDKKTDEISDDCIEVVPYDIMKEDQNFCNYLYESNNTIGQSQVNSLLRIVAYCNYTNLIELRREKIRRKCLEAWMLPNEQQNAVSKSIDETFIKLMKNWLSVKEFMMFSGNKLSKDAELSRIFHSRSDWFFVPVDSAEESGTNMRTFFMSCGGYDVWYYSSNGMWKHLQNIALEISGNTLIYGDIVIELNAEEKPITALHIIDGMVLGGQDIRHLPLHERFRMCERFANSLNKPSTLVMRNYGDKYIASSPITCKKFYPMNDFRQFFEQLCSRTLTNGRQRLGLTVKDSLGVDRWYAPRGILFMNDMKPNIGRAFSKTFQKDYFYDRSTRKTFFLDQIEDAKSIYASFKTTFVNRHLWEWKFETQVFDELSVKEKCYDVLYRCDLDEFIYE